MQRLLIVLYLLKIVPIVFNDLTGGFILIVQGIGGDDFLMQRPDRFNQALRRFKLAVFSVAFFFEQCAMASGAPVS